MAESTQLDIRKIEPEQAATVLSKVVRRRITADMIRADIEAGLPVNDDGTINLVTYAAWLNKTD
jgi:hypothetical protein